MLNDPQQIIDDFISAMAEFVGRNVEPSLITFDSWRAPHEPKTLPKSRAAVYVFSLSAHLNAPAGADRVIKVGKVGPNSNVRFRYQHYSSGSARSTLAGAIENNPILWGYIGFPGGGADAGAWLREHTDRNNFYFADPEVVGTFEVFAKARLGPIFEGSLSGGA